MEYNKEIKRGENTMIIKYNKEKLSEILNDLSVLTGIKISFLYTGYNMVYSTKDGTDFCDAYQSLPSNEAKCSISDEKLHLKCKNSGKYECHICHAGLYDAAMPIEKSGVVVGNIIMGRVRCADSPKEYFDKGDKRLSELYNKLPVFSERQLESLKSLLSNILFSNAIEVEYNETVEEITEYIENNFTDELSIGIICDKFFISKNYLYKCFKEHYNCTVNEYIIDLRIKKAKEIIKRKSMPIYSVCEKVGIKNYTYFCKLFKKRVGLSPTEYRKSKS